MNTKIISFASLVVIVAIIAGFQQQAPKGNTLVQKGMIKVTILYPNAEGKKFDMDYYTNKHMPLVASLLGDSLKLFGIDKGIGGRTPADPIPYAAIGYLYFDRLSAFRQSFGPHAEKIRSDIPNYTDIQPVIQISEVIQ
jgi:uncharacterized protein (TIGR02118 family)